LSISCHEGQLAAAARERGDEAIERQLDRCLGRLRRLLGLDISGGPICTTPVTGCTVAAIPGRGARLGGSGGSCGVDLERFRRTLTKALDAPGREDHADDDPALLRRGDRVLGARGKGSGSPRLSGESATR
jgi:hypothetical protein